MKTTTKFRWHHYGPHWSAPPPSCSVNTAGPITARHRPRQPIRGEPNVNLLIFTVNYWAANIFTTFYSPHGNFCPWKHFQEGVWRDVNLRRNFYMKHVLIRVYISKYLHEIECNYWQIDIINNTLTFSDILYRYILFFNRVNIGAHNHNQVYSN